MILLEPHDHPRAAPRCRTLFEAARGSGYEALYVVAVTAGLRRGELLGFSWEDVDFERRVLTMRCMLRQGKLLPPKTVKSRRSIMLPKQAVASLSEHRERAGRRVRHLRWLLDGARGRLPEPGRGLRRRQNLCSRHFKPLLREAGLPEIRFHDLRNTCATLLRTRGVHPKIVKEILGHANICITLDTYSHVMPGLVQLQDRFWVMMCSGALASWLTGAARSFLSAYNAALSLPGRSPDHALGKAAAGAMDDALS